MQILQQLVSEVGRLIPSPYFIKVGANDGVTGDPFQDSFLSSSRWKGLLIEPVDYCADRLAAIYSDSQRFIVERAAVGAAPGVLPFYYVSESARETDPELPSWINQLGSFSRSHVIKHLDGLLEPHVVSTLVKVDTLANVMRGRGLRGLTLLHVDAEGYDLVVLKSADLRELRPLVIFVEHRHLSGPDKSEMLSLLTSNRYTVRDMGDDFFAMLSDAPEPFKRFLAIGGPVRRVRR